MAMTVYGPREASAISAFARQTGFACSACHYQHFPELNAFGREFKAGGFTMIGGQSLIEGEVLSLPSVLNASLMTRAVYNNTYGDNKTAKASEYDNGTWDFPDDAHIQFAGRAGGNVGFYTAVSLMPDEAGRAVQFKIPFVFKAYDTQINIIPYSTNTAGPSWSFEVLNTGVTETHTPLLHKVETSAPQYVLSGGGGMAMAGTPATGIAFVAYKPYGYINYSLWARDQLGFIGGHQHIASPLHYLRAAVTPTIAGWDFGLGGAGWFGSETWGPLDGPTRNRASAWAIDAQAQGTVMNFPVGIYTSYAEAAKTGDSDSASGFLNIFNSGAKDKTAWTILGEVGIIPNKLAAAVGYRLGHNGDPGRTGENTTDNATTVGLTYNPALNIQFSLNHSWYSGSGSRSDESASGFATCPSGSLTSCPMPTTLGGSNPTSGLGQLTTITMWTVF